MAKITATFFCIALCIACCTQIHSKEDFIIKKGNAKNPRENVTRLKEKKAAACEELLHELAKLQCTTGQLLQELFIDVRELSENNQKSHFVGCSQKEHQEQLVHIEETAEQIKQLRVDLKNLQNKLAQNDKAV